MAGTSDFTGRIVSVVISVVVVAAVAIPIITGLTTGENPTVDPESTVGKILLILPVFLVLAILMIVVNLFLKGKN